MSLYALSKGCRVGNLLLVLLAYLYRPINDSDAMGARSHGQEGHLPPWKCCKEFLCISSCSKTLSRPIIYTLF